MFYSNDSQDSDESEGQFDVALSDAVVWHPEDSVRAGVAGFKRDGGRPYSSCVALSCESTISTHAYNCS
ncbi:unnamed protein product [Anisakis simplex]|uniref:Uncharacterized protein n=1 Tax=Anisakis simplex TaxID=6269 RepID=A0A0M3KB90_ANISI|nr:unnamed protein product [Anisakis simplex]